MHHRSLVAFIKVAQQQAAGQSAPLPGEPDLGKPPSAKPVKPPKPPTAFKLRKPKFAPTATQGAQGATEGTLP